MQNGNYILNELREISPVLAEIPYRTRLYELPEGYFENLADKILTRIKEASFEEALPDLFSRIDKKPVNNIPANYFETFPSMMMARIKAGQAASAKEELKTLSPLLDQIGKKMPFNAPAGYFSELPANLTAGAQALAFVNDELESNPLSPLMQSLKIKSTYQVPAGYFENLPERLLSRVKKQPQKAKVVSFRKSWVKYAVAAAITGLILTIGLINYNKPNTPVSINTDPISGLATVSDQEISNYIENQDLLLSVAGNSSPSVSDFNDNDINDLMSVVSDDELQQYANENMVN